jgi:hypothetical protein
MHHYLRSHIIQSSFHDHHLEPLAIIFRVFAFVLFFSLIFLVLVLVILILTPSSKTAQLRMVASSILDRCGVSGRKAGTFEDTVHTNSACVRKTDALKLNALIVVGHTTTARIVRAPLWVAVETWLIGLPVVDLARIASVVSSVESLVATNTMLLAKLGCLAACSAHRRTKS